MDRTTKVESSKTTFEALRKKGIATSLAIGIGISALAGCASNDAEATPEPAPTSTSVEATPTETPAPAESEKPSWYLEGDVTVAELPPVPAELEKYVEMTPEEFSKLPKNEQSLYASYLTQNREEFMKWFSTYSGDWISRPFKLTPESDALEKIEYNNYTYRIALSLTEGTPEPSQDGTCGPINEDAVKKLLLANTTVVDTAMEDADKIINAFNGQAVCASDQAIGDAFDSSSWTISKEEQATTTVDGQEAIRDAVNFTTPDGKQYSVDLLTMEVPTFDGGTEYQTFANYLYSPANGTARPQ